MSLKGCYSGDYIGDDYLAYEGGYSEFRLQLICRLLKYICAYYGIVLGPRGDFDNFPLALSLQPY